MNTNFKYIDSLGFKTFSTNIKLNLGHSSCYLNNLERQYMVYLIYNSISLNKDEKQEFLHNKLENISLYRIKKLISILEEEIEVFTTVLNKVSKEVVNSIVNERFYSWWEIEQEYQNVLDSRR